MTAAYRVVLAERKDILTVTVVCEECGSGISFNAETSGIPVACAACGKQYSEKLAVALVALGRFHREVKIAEQQSGKPLLRFEIRMPE